MKASRQRVLLSVLGLVVCLSVSTTAAPSDTQDLPGGTALDYLQQPQGVLQEEQAPRGSVFTQAERDGKVFVVLLKIQPDMCTTQDATLNMGTCLPAKDCTNSGGTASGTCAKGFGVCCIALRRCDSSTSYNNTYFVNPGYSGTDTGTGACTLTVNRVNSNICQVRLDFLDFNVEQPDIDGNCVTDFLTVTPSTVPMICGTNTGQHMYVDVDPAGGPIRVTVDRSTASTVDRSWNIKVSQIECNSENRAPTGCLQYYTQTSGTVYSYNFDQAAPTIPGGTRQIANLNYGLCVEMADGYCGIIWERNTTGGDYGFTMSENVNAIPTDIIGTPEAGNSGPVNCMNDYVIIPGGVDDVGNQNDRYCGLGFPNTVTSTNKPFVMYVVQDGDETGDFNNRGFCLNYRQITTC